MNGRFLSRYDMQKAKFEMDMFRLAIKRGQIKDADKITRFRHIVCGCGEPGCIFISVERRKDDKVFRSG